MKIVSPISTYVLDRISKIYGFKLYSVKPCSSHYKSIAAYHVKTSKGELLIKPYTGTPLRLAEIAANVKKLHKRGFRNMPDWLLTLSGKQWVKLNGHLYYVTDWVDGHELGARKSDFKRLGRVLAKLHRITKSITHGSIPPLYYSINVLRNNNRFFKQNLPLVQAKQTEMGQWFRDHGERCLSLGEEMRITIRRPEIRHLLRREVKRPSLTHGDITCPNVIIGSKKLQLIDWERVSKNTIYYEIAKVLSNTTNFSTSQMRALLHGYERVHPLHLDERLLISALFRFPREACYVCKSAHAEKQLFQILRDTWEQRLAAIEWLDNWARK